MTQIILRYPSLSATPRRYFSCLLLTLPNLYESPRPVSISPGFPAKKDEILCAIDDGGYVAILGFLHDGNSV